MKEAITILILLAVAGGVLWGINLFTSATVAVQKYDRGDVVCYVANTADGVGISCLKK